MHQWFLDLEKIKLFFLSCSLKKENTNELTIYSHRYYDVDNIIHRDFEKETGIKINLVHADIDELIEKITNEGKRTAADLLMTMDASRLNRAKVLGLIQPIPDKSIFEHVPSYFTAFDSSWVGITYRGRVIAYHTSKVSPHELSTYGDLAHEKWKNRILVKSSNSVCNQTLLASMLNHDGHDKASSWTKGLVANLAREPEGMDHDQMEAMVKGEGDLAIVNSYYFGLFLNSEDPYEAELRKKIALFFPNQETTGAHVNISGAALVKYAPNKENALTFLRYILSKEVQEKYTHLNFEYPVNKLASIHPLLESWGEFKFDTTYIDVVSHRYKDAIDIMKESQWN